MYKLYKDQINSEIVSVFYVNENGNVLSIPFDPDNTGYQAFKKAVLEGAQLLDADGNVISADFVKDLV